jgi:hypothetical protein
MGHGGGEEGGAIGLRLVNHQRALVVGLRKLNATPVHGYRCVRDTASRNTISRMARLRLQEVGLDLEGGRRRSVEARVELR